MNLEGEECPNCGENNQYKLILDIVFGKLIRMFCCTCKKETKLDH
jgi:hypothetical protein